MRIDYFGGEVADLKPKERTEENVIRVLEKHPKVSVWDMDAKWLREILTSLERRGIIADDETMAYPWIRYKVLKP